MRTLLLYFFTFTIFPLFSFSSSSSLSSFICNASHCSSTPLEWSSTSGCLEACHNKQATFLPFLKIKITPRFFMVKIYWNVIGHVLKVVGQSCLLPAWKVMRADRSDWPLVLSSGQSECCSVSFSVQVTKFSPPPPSFYNLSKIIISGSFQQWRF